MGKPTDYDDGGEALDASEEILLNDPDHASNVGGNKIVRRTLTALQAVFTPIASVFGRTGSVVAASGDYTADQITNTPAGGVAAIDVQGAIDELDGDKVPVSRQVAGVALSGDVTTAAIRTALETLVGKMPKGNFAGTIAPVSGDDSDDGYEVGSPWFDATNDKAYLCLDASIGAAIWQEVGAGGSVSSVLGLTGAVDFNSLASIGGVPASNDLILVYDSSAAAWKKETISNASPYATAASVLAAIEGLVGTVAKRTDNATAAPLVTDDANSGYAPSSTWVDTTNDKGYLCVDATAGAAVWIEVTGSGVTDHGALSGLGDDDHTQYLLADGTRAMSGDLNLGANNLVSSGLVDGRDVSADGSTLDDLDAHHNLDCEKATAGTITVGQAVALTGFDGTDQRPLVELADSDGAGVGRPVGLAVGDITTGGGFLRTEGRLAEIDTSSFASGDTLWLSTTAGLLTATRPSGDAWKVGKVIFSHALKGIIQIDIENVVEDEAPVIFYGGLDQILTFDPKIPFWVAPFDGNMDDIELLVRTGTSGSDAINHIQFYMKNETTGSSLFSTNWNTNGDEFVANGWKSTSPDQNLSFSKGDVFSYGIWRTGSITGGTIRGWIIRLNITWTQ